MSLYPNDTTSQKVVTVKIDGEDYRLRLSEQQDEHFLLKLAEDVDAVVKKMREEVPHVGYPYLLVLACLHLAEKNYTTAQGFPTKEVTKEMGKEMGKNFLEKEKVLKHLFAIEKKIDE